MDVSRLSIANIEGIPLGGEDGGSIMVGAVSLIDSRSVVSEMLAGLTSA